MSKKKMVLVATNGEAERQLLKIECTSRNQPHLGTSTTDIVIPLKLTTYVWEGTGDQRKMKKVEHPCHATYHNSGAVHLTVDDTGYKPPETKQQVVSPSKLNGDVGFHRVPFVVLQDLDASKEEPIKKTGRIVLTFDVREFLYPLFGGMLMPIFSFDVSFLPPTSDEEGIEEIHTPDSITFIVKSVNPWCRIIVKAHRLYPREL